jgi:hypothetical protein
LFRTINKLLDIPTPQGALFRGFSSAEDAMSRANLKESLFGLSKWVAFILGCGALFAGETQANKPQTQPIGTVGPANVLGLKSDEVLVRMDGERIYVSQDGSKFKELSLADAPGTAYLKELLRDANAADGQITVRLGPTIVANGGASHSGAKSKKAKKKDIEKKETPPAAK